MRVCARMYQHTYSMYTVCAHAPARKSYCIYLFMYYTYITYEQYIYILMYVIVYLRVRIYLCTVQYVRMYVLCASTFEIFWLIFGKGCMNMWCEYV